MTPAHLEMAARLCEAPHAFHPSPELAAELRGLSAALERIRAAVANGEPVELESLWA